MVTIRSLIKTCLACGLQFSCFSSCRSKNCLACRKLIMYSRAKEWRKKNKVSLASKRRDQYFKNPSKFKALSKRSMDKKKDKYKLMHKLAFVKRMYGLTEFEYYSLLIRHNSRCCVCGSNENLCIDHCHTTVRVRGILCRSCNLAIGKLGDSSVVLYEAYLYLKEFEDSVAFEQLLTLVRD